MLGGAGQLADALKDGAGFAGGAGATLGRVVATEERIDGDAEGVGQGEQLFGFKGDRRAFPLGEKAAANAELCGQSVLGKAGLLTGLRDALAEWRGLFGGRTTAGHAVIIRAFF